MKRRGGQHYVPLFTIAIDGPAGSGKSTTAKLVASALGFFHLDTGAMYRAITLLALESLRGSDSNSRATNSVESGLCAEDLTEAAREVSETIKLEFYSEHSQANESGESDVRLLANGVDITEKIRSAEVSASVSVIAADSDIREALVAQQRKFGERFKDIVAEGRDIGTVVFPDAELKVYLVADLKERARRRTNEMNKNGMMTTIEEQIEEITYRDEFDSNREASPLMQSADAVRVDTSGMTIVGQVQEILRLVRERQSGKGVN